MATKQRIVYGASTEWSTDGSTYTNLPEAKGLVVPTPTTEYQEATSLDSEDGYREYVPGLKDAGELSIPMGYTSAAYNTAFGYSTNKTRVYFRTTMPLETGQATGDVFTFSGFVTPELETNAVGDIIGMTLMIRTTGAPSFTQGTAA